MPEDLQIQGDDGPAELTFAPPVDVVTQPSRSKEFIVKFTSLRSNVPDEEKGMAGPAREIARFINARLIDGKRIILIEDGKIELGKR